LCHCRELTSFSPHLKSIISLSRGLTVYRDQEFSGDMMQSHAVKRIEDVSSLRGRQFAEDAGPMSHPVRPDSYISMDNFYTETVYSKGAEVVRMYRTLLGKDGFRKGMDLYFERHDGNAVTCDDFLSAMADANDVDLSQFSRWYQTNGTPTVKYSSKYDDESKTFYLTLSQESNSEEPLHIPISVGLLDKASGEEVVATKVLDLKEKEQTFEFNGLDGDVLPSILRGFSAPVKLVRAEADASEEEDLAFLAARDTDGFNRWEAGQKLYTSLIFQTLEGKQGESKTSDYVEEAFGRALNMDGSDYSVQAYALTLPSESTLAEEMTVVDPVALHKARGDVRKSLARKYFSEIRAKYDKLTESMQSSGSGEDIKLDATSIGQRRLRNVLLGYLCCIKDTAEERDAASELAMKQFESSYGMTDRYSALDCLASMDGEESVVARRDTALQKFFDDANGDALVLNKWFMCQAVADLPDVLDRVKALVKHPDFTLTNPNRCSSLISAFTTNAAHFHAEDGEGYKFLSEMTAQVDKLNPQLSSRMGRGLIQWRKYSEERGALMKAELEKLAEMKPISSDLFEVVSTGLKK
jgi:aminopeptidase N